VTVRLNHNLIEPRFGTGTRDALFLSFLSCFEGFVAACIARRLSRTARPEPPRNGCFLILLLKPTPDGDAFLGDLEQRFRQIANDPTQGPVRAHFWYWFQVLISVFAFMWVFLKRITLVAGLYEAIRKAIR